MPWARHFLSLSFGFSIRKMGTSVPTSELLFLCEALEGWVPSGLRASELPLVEKAWHLLIRPRGRLSKRPCEQPEIVVYPERPAFTPNAGEAGEVAAPCPSRGDMPPD